MVEFAGGAAGGLPPLGLRGAWVALFTPLSTDGTVHGPGVKALVDYVLDGGIDGIVALGTTGEFPDLSPDERAEVLTEVVAAAAGRVPVIAGVGGVGTTEACANAVAAQQAGADGVVALPPLFWKLGDDELYAHFRAVAAATDLPVVLYDFPSLTAAPLSPDLVARLAVDEPQIVGIKQSLGALATVHAMLEAVKPRRPDFSVMVGFEDLALPAMLAGGDGGISGLANVAPRLVADLAATSDAAARAVLHQRVAALTALYRMSNPPILALKVAAAHAGAPIEPVVRTAPAGAELIADTVRAWMTERDLL